MKEYLEKANFETKMQKTKNHEKFRSMQKVNFFFLLKTFVDWM